MPDRERIGFSPVPIEETAASPLWLVDHLTPESLSRIIPGYVEFAPSPQNHLVYVKKDKVIRRSAKNVVCFLGSATVGKDTILNAVLSQVSNQVFFPLTATTRPPRDESDRMDFFLAEEFELMKASDELIEWIKPGNYSYGTPVASMRSAIEGHDKPIIVWRGDLYGSQAMRDWCQDSYADQIQFSTLFIVSDLSFAQLSDNIATLRGELESGSRISKAIWEYTHAPDIADILLLNKYNPQPHAIPTDAIEATVQLFKSMIP